MMCLSVCVSVGFPNLVVNFVCNTQISHPIIRIVLLHFLECVTHSSCGWATVDRRAISEIERIFSSLVVDVRNVFWSARAFHLTRLYSLHNKCDVMSDCWWFGSAFGCQIFSVSVCANSPLLHHFRIQFIQFRARCSNGFGTYRSSLIRISYTRHIHLCIFLFACHLLGLMFLLPCYFAFFSFFSCCCRYLLTFGMYERARAHLSVVVPYTGC